MHSDAAVATAEAGTAAAADPPGLIGVLMCDFEPFSAEVMKGVSAALRGTGFDVLASTGASHRDTIGWERDSLRRLRDARVEGVIAVTPSSVLAAPGLPLIVIGPLIAQVELPSIGSDDFGGAVLAVRHLVELGHRRIALLGGRPDLESSHLREAGYRRALADAGIPFDADLARVGHYSYDASLGPVRELLSREDPPTAVFAANDASAIAAVEVARGLGVAVPERLSIVGFDDVPDASRIAPALTTVRQPLHRMGRSATRALLTLIGGGTLGEERVLLRNRLVVRGSTAPPAVG
ncbi:LacI family transcriptional regulator [Rathayibacter oskolensis]|uniref:LacI family transcriptional regulator n=1 Tax=Rathayibacter oskolensis TaxID=1891671 RepID=A0A1X7NYT2_9MICO|nr:substrate-binding domain-containing protein [Rathayibacter oskolensis]SMH43393.1 LacI family transcriptional regulator [Rathayibacter oskolensis]